MAFSKIVVEALANEVDILDATARGLDEEFAALQKRREAVNKRRAMIRELLASENPPPEQPESFLTVQSKDDSPTVISSTSLRGSIMSVLESSGKALPPKQVVELLRKAGYKDSPELKTQLSTRVWTEIFRMKNRGLLVKTEDGYSPALM